MSSSAAVSKKTVKKATESVAAPAVVAAPVVDAPKKAIKKATASAAPSAAPSPSPSRAASPAAHAPAAAPAPVEAAAPAAVTEERSLADEITALQQQLTTIRDAASSALSALKRVARRAAQDVKEAGKRRRKTRTTEEGAPRKPNNFQTPVAISDELSAFLGGGKNATMSRTEVNSKMSAFVKSNHLNEGQTIHLTATPELTAAGFNQKAADSLRKLLTVPDGEKLTIFNIQKYMSRHYPKPAATA
jgi:chromatin remodeling complex protein RSC6